MCFSLKENLHAFQMDESMLNKSFMECMYEENCVSFTTKPTDVFYSLDSIYVREELVGMFVSLESPMYTSLEEAKAAGVSPESLSYYIKTFSPLYGYVFFVIMNFEHLECLT